MVQDMQNRKVRTLDLFGWMLNYEQSVGSGLPAPRIVPTVTTA